MRSILVIGITAALLAATMAPAQETPPEVRQIVTFRFLPSRVGQALSIYRDIKTIYEETETLLRFRAYREAESPEPLDLVLVTSVRGLAGFERANAQMRARPADQGPSITQLYSRIAGLSEGHHDQFVEMIDTLAFINRPDAPVQVLESVRVFGGSREAFEQLLGSSLVPWERSAGWVKSSETGRVLIGDGWDYVRFLGFDSLAELHDYLRDVRRMAFHQLLDNQIQARKRIVLREEPQLAVR